MTKRSIVRASRADLETMEDRGVDRPRAGPDLGAAFWSEARVVFPSGAKRQLTMRLDADIVAYFKAGGRGYQTRINAVLRSFVEAASKRA